MLDDTRLHEALELLGALLSERNQPFHLVAIGGGALLLLAISERATADLDVVARRRGRGWTRSRPLPAELVRAVEDVAQVLGLPGPAADKPWLNDGPSFLFEIGLPEGWETRTTTRTFGALTLSLLGREDIVTLKLWAATDGAAPERRARDIQDLRILAPTREELLRAARWCSAKDDGTGSFVEASGLLDLVRELGASITRSELDGDGG